MKRWLFRLKCFLRNLPTFWIRRKYYRVWVRYSAWGMRKSLGPPVTLAEIMKFGHFYAPYIPLTVSSVDPEMLDNYRSWAKKEIAQMEQEMAAG